MRGLWRKFQSRFRRAFCGEIPNSLTVSLGVRDPDKLRFTLATAMSHIIIETDFNITDGIIRHAEVVDLLPANNSLTGIELVLASPAPRRRTGSAGTPGRAGNRSAAVC
ncbi:MAG: hypothetical protein LBK41_04305 [Clostridiales bacterium]|nr:hypothetical protein [Clostridiales bacterium]